MKSVFLLTIVLLIFSLSASGQSRKDSALNRNIKDFENAVYEVEENYAGFISKTSDPARYDEYIKLKEKLHIDILNGRDGADVVGELYGWFGDNHLTTVSAAHNKYTKMRKDYIKGILLRRVIIL